MDMESSEIEKKNVSFFAFQIEYIISKKLILRKNLHTLEKKKKKTLQFRASQLSSLFFFYSLHPGEMKGTARHSQPDPRRHTRGRDLPQPTRASTETSQAQTRCERPAAPPPPPLLPPTPSPSPSGHPLRDY